MQRRLLNLSDHYRLSGRSSQANRKLAELVVVLEDRFDLDSPSCVPTLDRITNILRSSGQFSKAALVALHATTILVRQPEWQRDDVFGRMKLLATLHVDCGRVDDADAIYKEALDWFPKSTNLMGVYGFFLFAERRREQESREWLRKSHDEGAGDANILANRAMAELAAGNGSVARDLLTELFQSSDTVPDRAMAKVLALLMCDAIIEGDEWLVYARCLKGLLRQLSQDLHWNVDYFLECVRDRVGRDLYPLLELAMRAVSGSDAQTALVADEQWAALEELNVSDLLASTRVTN